MAATWTAPRTWNVGELVTKSIMDSHVRNNFDFLRTPPGNIATITSNISTTSTSLADVTGASITITMQGGSVLLWFQGTLSVAAGPVDETVQMAFSIDAVDGAILQRVRLLSTAGAGDYKGVDVFFRTGVLSAASHTFKLRWRSTAGASITIPGTLAFSRFIAVETWF